MIEFRSKTLGRDVLILALLCCALPLRASDDLRLPDTDSQYRSTKSYVETDPEPDYQHASPAAIEAFRDIKYGVRIHWGLYSIHHQQGESWPILKMSFEQRQAYQELYKTWNPNGFDADEWMKLFKDCGLQMFAFTAKHHEGFSMFDTKTRVKQRANWTAPGGPVLENCDLAYSIMETPFHRDVVKELCDAGRRYGLKIDLYFSHPDWYDADFRPYCWSPIMIPDALAHPDLYGNSLAPQRTKTFLEAPDPTPEEQVRMMARHRQQLMELLSNYGKIDMVCLDMWLGRKNWPQLRDTIKALRKIQPDVMLRARGIGNYGDYYTPEGFVPGNKENTNMPWFVIYPLGRSFSYDPDGGKYKGAAWIIRNLVDAVAKGGRFMVAIGPDENGKFHPTAINELREAGAWLKTNGEAIYGSEPRDGVDWNEGSDIRFTRTKDGGAVYAIAMKWAGKQLSLMTVRPKPGSHITLLGDSEAISWTYSAEQGLTMQLPARDLAKGDTSGSFAYAFKIEVEPTRGK